MKKKLLFVFGGLIVILIIAVILLSLHNSNKNIEIEQEESGQEEVMVSLRQAREDLIRECFLKVRLVVLAHMTVKKVWI